MRLKNEALRQKILECAKQEFLLHGFLGAQLREIASKAGVTTGSIYKYFKDKAALFNELVEGPAKTLENLYIDIQTHFSNLGVEQQVHSLPDISSDGQIHMMHYIYEEYDAFKLIACSSTGTCYAQYIDTLVNIEVTASKQLIRKMQEAGMQIYHIDDELIHIVSSALFNGMFETVRHDMPKEKAFVYMETLRDFYSAGWLKILGL